MTTETPTRFFPLTVKNDSSFKKILAHQRKNKSKIRILFTSLYWDSLCEKLVLEIEKKEFNAPFYIVNSFDCPESFAIYGITQVPTLVILNDRAIHKEDYIPKIYKELGV